MAQTFLLSRFVSQRGAGLLHWLRSWSRVFRFAGEVLAATVSPSLYNRLTRTVTAKQIYFTAWQILPGFTLFVAALTAVLARIVESSATRFGISAYALELVVRVLVVELIPLLAALFVALRSGAAMTTEMALMRIAGELGALRRAGVDPMRFELVPRVVASALSLISLTVLNCATALLVTYLGLYGFTLWGLPEFTRVLGAVFNGQLAFGFALKCALFGVAVAVIPIAEGLAAEPRADAAPVAVLEGMVRLFFAIVLLEVLSLTAVYI